MDKAEIEKIANEEYIGIPQKNKYGDAYKDGMYVFSREEILRVLAWFGGVINAKANPLGAVVIPPEDAKRLKGAREIINYG